MRSLPGIYKLYNWGKINELIASLGKDNRYLRFCLGCLWRVAEELISTYYTSADDFVPFICNEELYRKYWYCIFFVLQMVNPDIITLCDICGWPIAYRMDDRSWCTSPKYDTVNIKNCCDYNHLCMQQKIFRFFPENARGHCCCAFGCNVQSCTNQAQLVVHNLCTHA